MLAVLLLKSCFAEFISMQEQSYSTNTVTACRSLKLVLPFRDEFKVSIQDLNNFWV